MSEFMTSVTAIVTAIIGVAIVALIVSNKSNTVGVIQAAASGLGNSLGVAIAPVTGASYTPNLTYPSTGGGYQM